MPLRPRSLLLLAAVLALVATATLRFGAGPSDAAVSSTLHGMVNDNYEIALAFDDGSPVTSIPPGSYRVVVSDTTTEHNFHLFGPGVEQSTGVSAEGTSTWNVTFQAGGRYQFVCDLHSDTMYGRFDATAPPTRRRRAAEGALQAVAAAAAAAARATRAAAAGRTPPSRRPGRASSAR